MADVSTPTAAYNRMQAQWKLPRALMGGTETMRQAGEEYLPREEAETDRAYAVRLSRSVLINAYSRLLKSAVGKVFAKPPSFLELPPEMEPWIEDFDLQGRHFNLLAHDGFEDGLADGLSHFLIDMTRPVSGGPVLTLRDVQVNGIRPYVVCIHAGDVIEQRFEDINGRPVLTRVRIKENQMVPDGEWGEKQVERVRVLTIGKSEIHEKGPGGWAVLPDHTVLTGLDFIPFHTFYAEYIEPGVARPPLTDVAWMNLRLWQSCSDQVNLLKIARCPMLRVGRDEIPGEKPKKIVLSGNSVFVTAPGDVVEFVEHSGAAIGAGRQDIEDILVRIQELGHNLTARETSGDVTATENSLQAVQAHSTLQAMAQSYQDTLELVLRTMGRMMGMDLAVEPSVIISKDFGQALGGSNDIQALISLQTAGILSKRQVLIEGKRRGFLSEDVNVDLILADASAEAEEAMMLNRDFAALAPEVEAA